MNNQIVTKFLENVQSTWARPLNWMNNLPNRTKTKSKVKSDWSHLFHWSQIMFQQVSACKFVFSFTLKYQGNCVIIVVGCYLSNFSVPNSDDVKHQAVISHHRHEIFDLQLCLVQKHYMEPCRIQLCYIIMMYHLGNLHDILAACTKQTLSAKEDCHWSFYKWFEEQNMMR